MLLTLLQAKIHNARVTGRHLDYHGSLTIDEDLIDAAGMRVGQQIQVYNSNNGIRFETYILRGQRGSGEIQVNGAAARLVEENDRIIICTFAQLTPEEADTWEPHVVICDHGNQVVEEITYK
ncbi:MAG: aspartate 1-decarboxylase [Planctomycetes bacterium]|nr:aspartate 1-decarboxylase [Planctomycetota bacterium]